MSKLQETMKILSVNVTFSLGGAAKIAQAIFREVGGNFFYGNGRAVWRDPEATRKPNVYRVGTLFSKVLNKYLFKIFGKDLFTAHKHLWRKEITKADIVHIHAIHSHFVNFSFLFRELISKKKKVVWTFHDLWALTARCALPNPCTGYESGCAQCVLTSNYPRCICCSFARNLEEKKYLVQSMPRENLIVVVPTRWMLEKVKKSYCAKFRIRLIRNGIDLSQFTFKQAEITESEKLRVLIVANCFGTQKGLDDFLAIVRKLPKVDFVIAGTIPKRIDEVNVFPLGYLSSRKKLIAEYHRANFMLFLSVDDNYPTVILESLACGTPVISYKGLGNKEIFEDIDYPYLLDNGHTEKVIRILNDFACRHGNLSEYEQVSQKGRALVEKNNDLRKMLKEYKELYEELLSK